MAVMLKTIAILMIMSFIAGGIAVNYAVNNAGRIFGGTSLTKPPEIKTSTPIEEIKTDFTTPPINIDKQDKVIITFPSLNYGEIKVTVPIKYRC